MSNMRMTLVLMFCWVIILVVCVFGCAVPKHQPPNMLINPIGPEFCEKYLTKTDVEMLMRFHNHASCMNELQFQKLKEFKQ